MEYSTCRFVRKKREVEYFTYGNQYVTDHAAFLKECKTAYMDQPAPITEIALGRLWDRNSICNLTNGDVLASLYANVFPTWLAGAKNRQ